jgi:hypothetical protein
VIEYSRGTGTIIGKHLDANDPNFAWLCVLTANHVVDPNDPNIVAAGGVFAGASTVIIGSNFTTPVEGPYGDANNIVRFGQRPAAQGGLGGVDIAVLGVRVPANSPAYTLLTPVTMRAIDPEVLITRNERERRFSQIGFGGTGNYVDNGMQGAGNALDGERRFQNNLFQATGAVNTGYYTYNAIRWFMNDAPSGGLPDGEGLSFGGDSGGPYFVGQEVFTHVPAFQRRFPNPNDPNDSDLPDWPGGLMPFYSNEIVAVHTRGNSSPNGFNPYGTWGAGVPLLSEYVTWINQQCHLIPTPSGLALVLVGTLVAFKRRRAP